MINDQFNQTEHFFLLKRTVTILKLPLLNLFRDPNTIRRQAVFLFTHAQKKYGNSLVADDKLFYGSLFSKSVAVVNGSEDGTAAIILGVDTKPVLGTWMIR